jgi:dUTP pyrophosphatase
MEVRVKKLHPDAVVPKYAKPGDAGLDLTAVDIDYVPSNNSVRYHTGLAFEIPEGYVGLIFQRSSIRDKDIILSNCVGVIDSGYRGEITFTYKVAFNPNFWTRADDGMLRVPMVYEIGDRIGQIIIIPYPQIELVESDELSETERGSNGFGSTGK